MDGKAITIEEAISLLLSIDAERMAAEAEKARREAEERARRLEEEKRRKLEAERRAREKAEAERRARELADEALIRRELRRDEAARRFGVILAVLGYIVLGLCFLAAIYSPWVYPHGGSVLSTISSLGYAFLAFCVGCALRVDERCITEGSRGKHRWIGVVRLMTCLLMAVLFLWCFECAMTAERSEAGDVNFLTEGLYALLVFFPWYYLAFVRFKDKEGAPLYKYECGGAKTVWLHFVLTLVWGGLTVFVYKIMHETYPDAVDWALRGFNYLFGGIL